MLTNNQMKTATRPAHVLLNAELLEHTGDAILHYLEDFWGLDANDIGVLFRAAGLGFESHRANHGSCPYREQLDAEIVGHVLSLEDRIKDRSERLTLIEHAIESAFKIGNVADIEAAVSFIRKERMSHVTLESCPERYRKSLEAMKQDLMDILHVRGGKTTLGAEEIVRFFGVEDGTFRANFAKIASELRDEFGVVGEEICHADFGVVAYKFEVMV
jgi:hypothetical protein